jgi:hypothetical protein
MCQGCLPKSRPHQVGTRQDEPKSQPNSPKTVSGQPRPDANTGWVGELGCMLDQQVGLEVGLDVGLEVGFSCWPEQWRLPLTLIRMLAWSSGLWIWLDGRFGRWSGRWVHVGLDVSLSIGLACWPGWPRYPSLAMFFNCMSLPIVLANHSCQFFELQQFNIFIFEEGSQDRRLKEQRQWITRFK